MDRLFDQFIDELEGAICNFCAIDAECQFCGRKHVGVDEYQGVGLFDGNQYVLGCRCEKFMEYAKFLYEERLVLLQAYKKFGEFLVTEGMSFLDTGHFEIKEPK